MGYAKVKSTMASIPALDRAAHFKNIRDRYRISREMLDRAKRTIPLGSQTFSKSHIQFPSEAAPHFLVRGHGAHVWDVDGNEYVDFVNGLLPVILGYCDPDVDTAVEYQLRKGVSFSLATDLEIELAETLVRLIPCAEQVRFGKNGTDATSAAIRLARAFTGRDRVAVCGYHGWQDWYIGSTLRHKGVPEGVRSLTSTFSYNDLGSLEEVLDRHPSEYAAVIMEPMNVAWPVEGFLPGVQELAHRHGALFVLDEIITGFRFGLGGAQALFGVTPDLATFGKSMGNGFPISAVVGRRDVMMEMNEIFFSGTFGGETLSLAASLATIKKMEAEPVLETLHRHGGKVMDNTREAVSDAGLTELVEVVGHPSWSLLVFKDAPNASLWELKSVYVQEVIASGVLSGGSHNMSYAHDSSDLERLAAAQRAAFRTVRDAMDSGDVRGYLAGPPMEPLFRVR